MQILKISLIVIFIVYVIILLGLCYKSKKFLKSLIISSFIGLFAFMFLQLLSPVLNIKIPLNMFSVSVSAILGIPGIAGMLILNLLF